jgi:acyl-CoA thioesterase
VSSSADQRAAAVGEAMYARDTASQALGMALEQVRPGYARLRMAVRADMLNGHGSCHGGMVFALADSAFAFACNSHDVVTVASSCSIEFLAPAQEGDELVAEAEERFREGRNGVYDVNVRRGDGSMIATFRGRSASTRQSVLG